MIISLENEFSQPVLGLFGGLFPPRRHLIHSLERSTRMPILRPIPRLLGRLDNLRLLRFDSEYCAENSRLWRSEPVDNGTVIQMDNEAIYGG